MSVDDRLLASWALWLCLLYACLRAADCGCAPAIPELLSNRFPATQGWFVAIAGCHINMVLSGIPLMISPLTPCLELNTELFLSLHSQSCLPFFACTALVALRLVRYDHASAHNRRNCRWIDQLDRIEANGAKQSLRRNGKRQIKGTSLEYVSSTTFCWARICSSISE